MDGHDERACAIRNKNDEPNLQNADIIRDSAGRYILAGILSLGRSMFRKAWDSPQGRDAKSEISFCTVFVRYLQPLARVQQLTALVFCDIVSDSASGLDYVTQNISSAARSSVASRSDSGDLAFEITLGLSRACFVACSSFVSLGLEATPLQWTCVSEIETSSRQFSLTWTWPVPL